MSNIFKSDVTYESAKDERPTRSSLSHEETDHMARLPGSKKYPGHDVKNVIRARRGYTTY